MSIDSLVGIIANKSEIDNTIEYRVSYFHLSELETGEQIYNNTKNCKVFKDICLAYEEADNVASLHEWINVEYGIRKFDLTRYTFTELKTATDL